MFDKNVTMQDLEEIICIACEKHKVSWSSRIKKYALNISRIYEKLLTCSSFSGYPPRRNIISGIVEKDDVKVYGCDSVGKNVIRSMIGKNACFFPVKWTDKEKALNNLSVVTVS